MNKFLHILWLKHKLRNAIDAADSYREQAERAMNDKDELEDKTIVIIKGLEKHIDDLRLKLREKRHDVRTAQRKYEEVQKLANNLTRQLDEEAEQNKIDRDITDEVARALQRLVAANEDTTGITLPDEILHAKKIIEEYRRIYR